MKKIEMLDCTLRDGAYITKSYFGDASIRGIIQKMEEAGIEIIECGWLKNDVRNSDSTYFHVPNDLAPFIVNKNPEKIYTVMIDWDRYDLTFLPQNNGKTLDAIRVVFPRAHYTEGIEVGKNIYKKGYKVFFQAADTLSYTDEELIDLSNKINETNAEALSVVDTFGAMYPEDLEHIIDVLDKNLKTDIRLGFHSHNNQQLSFALSMHFVNLITKSKRNGIVDASLCGIGRGAGNATTELVTSFLNKKCGAEYDLDAVMDAIDIYMHTYKEMYQWGYSTPYFIAGLYGCHVNNISYLLDNHRTSAKDMRNIIASLSQSDRKKYDYDLLEKKYIDNKNYQIDDKADIEQLKSKLCNRKVVLIAPGKTSIDKRNEINHFIEKENPIVIGVNAILPEYKYDFLLFVNSARYNYAMNAYPTQFRTIKHIVFSNIKRKSPNEFLINLSTVIKRGWKYYDNAVICALRMLERIGVNEVFIAGFDGFRNSYNESYADEKLPSLNPNGNWDELNREIKEMFIDFISNTDLKVNFLTKTIYEA